MQAGEATLAKLLEGRKQFQVPLFQRRYSWEHEQLAKLWSDIVEQAELSSEESSGSTHFIGSVVCAPSPKNMASFPRMLVVDGQQRLTTLSVALAAIRDHVAVTDPGRATVISQRFLENVGTQGDDVLRLLPTQFDRPAYRACITKAQPPSDNSLVGPAYRFFRAKLAELQDETGGQLIEQFEQIIAYRLTLVEVTADKQDNVYRIFQSLNNTGLELTQADLLRNYLFMHMPERGESVYEKWWAPLQEDLPKSGQLDHLIWLKLVLDGESRARRQDVFRAEQVRFAKTAQTEQGHEDYIVELVRRSMHYLVVARVSKTCLPVFTPTGQVMSEQIIIFASDAVSALALLSSGIHYAWAVARASSLKGDLRYTPSDVYETLPQPESPSNIELSRLGSTLDEMRAQTMREHQIGLTKLYNAVHDSSVTDADTQHLRVIHEEIDQAVAAAYGWSDLDLSHGFRQTRQGLRHTLSPATQVEVLDRLLELNHNRHSLEEANIVIGTSRKQASANARRSDKTANERMDDVLF